MNTLYGDSWKDFRPAYDRTDPKLCRHSNIRPLQPWENPANNLPQAHCLECKQRVIACQHYSVEYKTQEEWQALGIKLP